MSADRSPLSEASASPDLLIGTNTHGGRRSLIFFYYHNVTETVTACGGYISATCNICWMVLRGNKGVTSNFVSHLRRRHPSHYSVFVQCRAEQVAIPDSSGSPHVINIDSSPSNPNDSLCYEAEDCSIDSGQLHAETSAAEVNGYGVDSTSVLMNDFLHQSAMTNTAVVNDQVQSSRASRPFVNRADVGISRLSTASNNIPCLVPITSCYTYPTTSMRRVSEIPPTSAYSVNHAGNPLPSPDPTSSQQERVTASVTKYVVQSLKPLAIVEDVAFRNLITELQPGCAITSAYDLRINVLPEMIEKATATIRDELRKVENVSLSVNSGETLCGRYQAVTVHFVKEGRLRSALLACDPGQSSEEFVNYQMCKYRLENKIYKTVSDSFKPVSFRLLNRDVSYFKQTETVSVFQRSENEDQVLCFERHLEAVIKTALTLSTQICTAISEINRVTKKVNTTNKVASTSDIPSSWNHDLKVIRQIVEKSYSETELANYVRVLGKLTSILEPFEEVMDMVKSEETVPISLVLPSVVSLKKLLECDLEATDDLNNIRKVLRSQLEERFGHVLKDKLYVVSAFLDPRFKLSWCGDDVEERRALEVVRAAVEGSDVERALSIVTSKDSSLSLEPPKKKIFQQLRHNTARKQTCVDEEIKTYLNESLEDERREPIAFWYERSCGPKPLPILAKLSKKVLSVPASSTSITRILDSVRSDNKPDDLRKLVFLKANLAFWLK